MLELNAKEIAIIKAIHHNHKKLLENQMIAHFGVYFEQSKHPEKLYSWVEKIEDTRLLANHYLDTIALSQAPSTISSLEKETAGSSYFFEKAKLLIPESIRNFIFDISTSNDNSLFNFVAAEVFSLALGKSITDILFDYFNNEFLGAPEDAQKEFNKNLEKQTELSNLIQKECERISIKIIKLFHFREMLLLGKISKSPTEPNAREEFITRAKITNEPKETIHLAIEIYFARELSNIFNTGFKSLYRVHDVEIQSEHQSPLVKWVNKMSESEQIRLAFTQEIQLKFMLLAKDFLLEKMNQKGVIARYPIIFSLLAGVVLAPIVGITMSIIAGGAFLWAVIALSVLVFALASICAHLLINKLSLLTYQRSADNRTHIQQSIDMINGEFLRLKKESLLKKEITTELIENTRDFEKINQNFLLNTIEKKVARGSVSGWLREYASRYRHSKAVEVDLGDEYKELIIQSRIQTQELIRSVNKKKSKLLTKWIHDTTRYLRNEENRSVIEEFELIPKIKEQVLEIVSQLEYIPPALLEFYSNPKEKGGLEGNESDFAHIIRFTPTYETEKLGHNPYQHLCDTALNLFKKYEPLYTSNCIFLGDPVYRQMLGIARRDQGEPITAENINAYLNNSYAFLLSLCHKVKPGFGLDPLQQTVRVTDEFILYRMLLLKQLATLSEVNNKEISNEVKFKIRLFIQKHFNQDTKVIFDDLANQMFLLNKGDPNSRIYKNNDHFEVLDTELDNIIQAINLDVAYSTKNFNLIKILGYFIDKFIEEYGTQPALIFAYGKSEQEINPQGTEYYFNTLSQYCKNTAEFLKTSQTNKALTATNILDCYQYDMSLQIYRTQIRIISNIKEVNQLKATNETDQQIKILLKSFELLSEFSKTHCYSLKPDSSCCKLFNLINSKAKLTHFSRDWIKHIDAKEALLYILDNLSDQLELSSGHNTSLKFFSLINKQKKETTEIQEEFAISLNGRR
ncbi:hypothetical protein EP47_08785 [Legionella norrlandica]|uniref:Uncharacterized protein n=1 Tax=Legionella norrlandica TaxID=1498499 RepID=A0A0A2STA6_9GAMM|nr:hypothetical protein [Legionella norrlandica]KGP63982.1 hypothetical protein EP47_08785 [Legionella norrlandica]